MTRINLAAHRSNVFTKGEPMRVTSLALLLFPLLLLACDEPEWSFHTIDNAGELRTGRVHHRRAELGARDGRDGHRDARASKAVRCASPGGPRPDFCNLEFVATFSKAEAGERVAVQVLDKNGTPIKTVYIQDPTVGRESVFLVGVPCPEDGWLGVRIWIEAGNGNVASSLAFNIIRAVCEATDKTDHRQSDRTRPLYDADGRKITQDS